MRDPVRGMSRGRARCGAARGLRDRPETRRLAEASLVRAAAGPTTSSRGRTVMTTTEPQTVLIGTFPDRARAEHFVEELRRAGFRDDQIGVATPGGEAPSGEAGDAALAGVLTGGTMGALA